MIKMLFFRIELKQEVQQNKNRKETRDSCFLFRFHQTNFSAKRKNTRTVPILSPKKRLPFTDWI